MSGCDADGMECERQIKTEPEEYNEWPESDSEVETKYIGDMYKFLDVKTNETQGIDADPGQHSIKMEMIKDEPKEPESPEPVLTQSRDGEPEDDWAKTRNRLVAKYPDNGKPRRRREYCCEFQGCGLVFPLRRDLRRHSVVHPNETFQCNFEGCDRVFEVRSQLTRHSYIHRGVKRFKCNYPGCGSAFCTRYNLRRHMITHTGERPFKCDVEGCDRRFGSKWRLRDHLNSHTSEMQFKCKFGGCGAAFYDKLETRVHELTHASEVFKCPVEECPLSFLDVQTLQEHLDTYTHKKVFKCDFEGCDSSFAQENEVVQHSLVHTSQKSTNVDFRGSDLVFLIPILTVHSLQQR